jgi:hypothetical protein
MHVVLETPDRELVDSAVAALAHAGIRHTSASESLDGGIDSWRLEVQDADAIGARAIVDEVNALLMEARSTLRCPRCNRGMITNDADETDGGYLEFLCRGCGFSQLVPIS